MPHANSSLYTPYGAYELKATYQRNLCLGMAATAAFTLLILVAGRVLLEVGNETRQFGQPGDRIEVVVSIPPPMTIERPSLDIQPASPTPAVRPAAPIEVAVPAALHIVDDELFDEEAVRMATNDERRGLVSGGSDGGGAISEGELRYGFISEPEEAPGINDLVIVDRQPELIYAVKPTYPRLAEQAGLEGRVIIKALISEEGDVLDAVVFGTSDHVLLDEAALAVAGQYKYRPAVRDGSPVKVWVTYNVEFELD